MSVPVDSLISELRTAYGDDLPDEEQALSVQHLTRSIQRAAAMLNRDFGSGYRIQDDAVSPDPSSNDREILLLAAMVSVSEMMLARYARFPKVKSGDKTVSHDGQVDAWSRLHARYLEQYQDSVAAFQANRQDEVDPLLYG